MFLILCIILVVILIAITIYLVAKNTKKKKICETFKKNYNDLVNISYDHEKHNKINIPIYYINLDRSPERNRFMEMEFKKHGITNFKRVKAIEGKNIKQSIRQFAKKHIYTVDNITFWNNYTNLKASELACTLSHINAIRTAYQDGHEMVLIMEDDTSFGLLPYWTKTLSQYVDEFPKNWGCVSLFNMACYTNKKLPDYIKMKDVACNGAVAYIINRDGMKSALETMSNDLLVMDKNHVKNNNNVSKFTSLADVFIYNRIENCYQRKLPLFIPYNEVGVQDSTIHTHHTWRHNLFTNEIVKMYNSTLSLKDLK